MAGTDTDGTAGFSCRLLGATATRPGAIAILQLEGDVEPALRALTGVADWPTGRARLVRFDDVDRGLAVRLTERVAQLMPHGGPRVVQRLYAWMDRLGIKAVSCEEIPPRLAFPERRRAWVGELPWDPGLEVRIEAGGTGGRIVAFDVLRPATIDRLSDPFARPDRPPIVFVFFNLILLIVVIVTIFAAWRSVRRGQAPMHTSVAATMSTWLVGMAAITRVLRGRSRDAVRHHGPTIDHGEGEEVGLQL